MALAVLADGLDQIPLTHLGAAGDVSFLRDLVELLSRTIFEFVAAFSAARPCLCGLPSEVSARFLGQVGQRSLALRSTLSPLDVLLRRP